MQHFLATRVDALIKSVGVNDVAVEPHQRKYARALAIELACKVGNEHCVVESNKRLGEVRSNGNEFHQNVRPALYCAALRNTTAESFKFVWDRLVASDDAAYRAQLFTALGCAGDEQSLVSYLDSALPSTNANNVVYLSGDHLRVFTAVYTGSQLGLEKAIKFLTVHLAEARTQYGLLNTVLTGLASRVVSAERRADVSAIHN